MVTVEGLQFRLPELIDVAQRLQDRDPQWEEQAAQLEQCCRRLLDYLSSGTFDGPDSRRTKLTTRKGLDQTGMLHALGATEIELS
jgi:hypothetical protein